LVYARDYEGEISITNDVVFLFLALHVLVQLLLSNVPANGTRSLVYLKYTGRTSLATQ